ncbi:SRPBCC family protein [Streptomyces sp. NRRL S-237]|uniref:SRPBCC family protein n=1 Tax=Streptomyces sp. NRRL S-237 TaxID=1463895 RepID=UPI0004CB40A6|nr:SRPBCC family protein [Streptomyces sp. NRRL S-237]
MARHWHPLGESRDDFLVSAPFRYEHSVETTAPAERIWEILTGEQLVDWVWAFTALKWNSPPPFGVGTARDVTLLKFFTVRERFFRWDEGRRYTFSVYEASRPGLRHAAEDWTVEPTPSGSRLTWTMAIRPTPLVTPLLWVGSPLIRLVQRHALRAVRRHVRVPPL